jgi:transposase
MSGQQTELRIEARRFRCMNGDCTKRTFVQRFAFLPFKAQRTARFTTILQAIAFSLGGEAGHRLAAQLQMPTSLLRLIRNWSPPQPPKPRIVGIDDWALRKRVSYGTIVVDGPKRGLSSGPETHKPIELLKDRTAVTVKDWLLEQKGIEVIARDRSGEYALGAKEGAPQALQVADRFHLLQNLKQMLDRLLTNMYQQIRPLLVEQKDIAEPIFTHLLTSIRDTSTSERKASKASREQRLQTYQLIKQLQTAGWKIGQIARRLDTNPTTVRKYFYAESFPERNRRAAGGSILNPYITYLESRYWEGCQNAMQLWGEIKEKGYPGTHRQVSKWMGKRRHPRVSMVDNKRTESAIVAANPGSPPPSAMAELASPRQLAWLMLREIEQLKEEERELLLHIEQDTQVKKIYSLAQRFIRLVKKQQAAQLEEWLKDCKTSGVALLQNFAIRIEQDYAAVRAALETQWSNGQTEGQINRLKLLKRQMYGRAKFDLLRKRVLYTN